MKPSADSRRWPPYLTAACLLAGVTLAAAYGQAPLYYSNQNQYLLHGLATAGTGVLHEDWLARTLDPTPVFTAVSAGTVAWLHPWLFYGYHALLLGLYAAALLGVFVVLVPDRIAAQRWPLFAVLLVLVHSAALRWCSYRWLGQDYPWYLQAGVAGQYILGAMFQPSVFGVLFVVAVGLFLWERPLLAAICVAGAGAIHATYLLPGALLTLGFVAVLAWEKRLRLALAVGGLALALVLPVLAFAWFTFGPTSQEVFAAAQDILVNVRIPHHSRVALWLDEIAGLQIAWIVLGSALAWGTRLFLVLAVPFVLALLLTVVQVITGSDTLALLFPWRISAVLVPLATTVILARLVGISTLPLDNKGPRIASVVLLLILAGAGLWISLGRLAFNTARDEEPLLEFVARTRSSGQVYFLPARVPNLAATTRGSLSSDFKPLPEKRQDARIIPVDLQRFRLHTGAPIFVDFKSIPYQDAEVSEWRERLAFAQEVQELLQKGRLAEAVRRLRSRGVTHLVWPAQQQLAGVELNQLHEGPAYRVYSLGGAP